MQQRHLACRAAFAILLAAALARPAAAQQGLSSIDPANDAVRAPTGQPGVTNSGVIDPNADANGRAPGGGGDDKDKAKTPEPPPSLPGSHAHPSEVAPKDRTATDTDPNAALFDAINRGDTVAARDALSRGADPGAHNVLGLTPIDLSVDLGRNDISFLLLSMRGNDQSAAPVPTTTKRAARTASSTTPVSSRRQASGTAAPSAGFLGFGGGS